MTFKFKNYFFKIDVSDVALSVESVDSLPSLSFTITITNEDNALLTPDYIQGIFSECVYFDSAEVYECDDIYCDPN